MNGWVGCCGITTVRPETWAWFSDTTGVAEIRVKEDNDTARDDRRAEVDVGLRYRRQGILIAQSSQVTSLPSSWILALNSPVAGVEIVSGVSSYPRQGGVRRGPKQVEKGSSHLA
jgi:hypothetical protein